MNAGCTRELRQLNTLLTSDTVDADSVCACTRAILEYLVVPEHNTAENCDAVGRYLVVLVFCDDEVRPRLAALPDELALIINDMATFLDDAHSATEIAASFDSLPEQLLKRLNAWSTDWQPREEQEQPRRPLGAAMNTANDKRRFIWRKGVLGWGLPVGLGQAVLMAFFYPEGSTYAERLLIWLCFLPVWAVGGYIFGTFMWSQVKRRS